LERGTGENYVKTDTISASTVGLASGASKIVAYPDLIEPRYFQELAGEIR
jgi:hypothetical protein